MQTVRANKHHYTRAAVLLHRHRDTALDAADNEVAEVKAIIKVQLKRQHIGIMPRIKRSENWNRQ